MPTQGRTNRKILRGRGEARLRLAPLLALALACGWLLIFAPALFAQEANQAALVILHGDGSTTTRCVEFTEPELSGHTILQRSQLPINIETGGMGEAVCSIAGEGCITPQEDCFCGMNRNPPVYWSYWQVVDGEWNYSQMGASYSVVRPGAVEGWIWGTGRLDDASPPPALTFEQICAPATATPTVTMTPEATPTPTETASATAIEDAPPSPTPTFTPTFTPWPTATSTLVVPTDTPTPIPSDTPSPTPTLSPTPTWTSRPTVTPKFAEQSVAVQPTVPPGYAVLLPALQAPAPVAAVAEVAAALAPTLPPSTPTPTDAPTNTATPTTITPVESVAPVENAAMVATLPPLAEAIATVMPEVVPEAVPTATPEVVVIVVTPDIAPQVVLPVAAGAPTLLPAAPALDATVLVGMIIGMGIIALPVGLIVVAAIAYWVGSRL